MTISARCFEKLMMARLVTAGERTLVESEKTEGASGPQSHGDWSRSNL